MIRRFGVPRAEEGTGFQRQIQGSVRAGRSLTNTRNDVIQRLFLNRCVNLSGVQRAVETEQICDKTRNMRCRHGSSREDANRPIVESRNDIETRSPDVDTGSEVGEICLCVVNCRGRDGDGLRDAGRGGGGDILVIVSCGNNDRDTKIEELGGTESLARTNFLHPS